MQDRFTMISHHQMEKYISAHHGKSIMVFVSSVRRRVRFSAKPSELKDNTSNNLFKTGEIEFKYLVNGLTVF